MNTNKRYAVYITPASGVGGEFSRPARWDMGLSTALRYANACRARGQKARVVRMDAGRFKEFK